MALTVKRSVAVMIFKDDEILAVRRPENDDELPGIWGLPAGTCRGGETIEDVIRRIGGDKLGVSLTPIRKLATGSQNRSSYRLEMELWEAGIEGQPNHPEWRWASTDSLRPGAVSGSLCCELAVNTKGRVG